MDIATQIKEIMINSLALEDLSVEDIDNDLELFSEAGLGLDSVDALELGLELQKNFGFTFNAEQTNLNQHFRSVNTLTNFIQSQLIGK